MIMWVDELMLSLFVFIRAGTLLFAIPVFSGRLVPVPARLALALLLAIIVTPLLPPGFSPPRTLVDVIFTGFQEMLAGLLMGMAVRIVFSTINFAGHIISTEMGLVMSSSVNPLSEGSSTTVGVRLFYFGTLVFLITGMHYEVIFAFVRSFGILPVGESVARAMAMDVLVRESSKIFLVGMQIAAPFIAVNFLVNLTFAVLGKAAPKVNVFMTSFAVRILTGFAILLATVGLIAHYIVRESMVASGNMLEFLSY